MIVYCTGHSWPGFDPDTSHGPQSPPEVVSECKSRSNHWPPSGVRLLFPHFQRKKNIEKPSHWSWERLKLQIPKLGIVCKKKKKKRSFGGTENYPIYKHEGRGINFKEKVEEEWLVYGMHLATWIRIRSRTQAWECECHQQRTGHSA